MHRTRRDVLGLGAGALMVSGVAGCVGGGDPNTDTGAYASFFTLADFARHVGGDALAVENAVPAGQHGHGWEPGSSLVPDIVGSKAFVYLAIDGFQPWAEDAADRIERDHGDEVALIDAIDGIELAEYGHDDHGGHDYDPHFWVDPVRAQRSVENVRDGLMELDEDNAEVYEENAADYLDELEMLHQRYESDLVDREHNVVVLAGHDSFRYLGERYDFELHSPHGISPDAKPSPGDIADTVEFVEQRGIEYVLYDHFDGDRLADRIVDEADNAVDTAPITSTESVTEEWAEEGLGYVGQMEEINLQSFELALGAD